MADDHRSDPRRARSQSKRVIAQPTARHGHLLINRSTEPPSLDLNPLPPAGALPDIKPRFITNALRITHASIQTYLMFGSEEARKHPFSVESINFRACGAYTRNLNLRGSRS
ncbi:hypothetical protein [Paraburkholderia tropica]|uniref:hypothetical protein n=1 Tax=Paraburkholderia tropica TaxID=92647 RepID=UPI001CC3B99E|nr:hypothetical protein [Paraburkholderia tropica]